MTGHGDADLDAHDVMSLGAPEPIGADPEHVERQQAAARRKQVGRKTIKYWVAGIAIVGVVSFGIHAVSSSVDAPPESVVGKGSAVNEPPGAPHPAPEQARAYQMLNEQDRSDAARSGKSSVQRPIMASEGEDSVPKPITAAGTGSQAAAAAPPLIPLNGAQNGFQPLGGRGAINANGGSSDMRAAIQKAVDETRKAGNGYDPLQHTSEKPEPISGNYAGAPIPLGRTASASGALQSERGVQLASSEEPSAVIAEPYQAYAVTRIGANSDAVAAISLEVLSGPLAGGMVYGKPAFQQKNMQIALDRLHYQGADYKIDAVVLDPETKSPALDADVANHYGERILLPGVAAFFGAAGRAASTPTTSISTATGTSSVTQTSPLSIQQDVAAGIGGIGTATGNVFAKDADQIKPTITLAANSPQIVVFLKGVNTGDRLK